MTESTALRDRIGDALTRAFPWIFLTLLLIVAPFSLLIWASAESTASWREKVETMQAACVDPRSEAVAQALLGGNGLIEDDELVIIHNGKLETLTAQYLPDRSLVVADREGNIVCSTPPQAG